MTVRKELPLQPASLDIWETKYQLKDADGIPVDANVDATYRRVAHAIAQAEKPEHRDRWEKKFLWALMCGATPAGRIISNVGTGDLKPGTSTINCTVSGVIPDSMVGILDMLKEAGLALKAGCGIGYDFSTLRPSGARVAGAGARTSGPLSFMDVFDATCKTVSSAGGRRGAQMGTLDVSHPDIEAFIKAKREDGRFRHFNLSCLVTDAFMAAVRDDDEWMLMFPASKQEVKANDGDSGFVYKKWPVTEGYMTNEKGEVACRVYETVRARDLMDLIMRSNYDFAEPGFILIDRVNEMNNLWFCEDIRATNPCFTGDTMVCTAEYGPVPFKKIADEFRTGRGSILVVSRDDKGELVYADMTNARMTKEGQELVEVSFSRGGPIRCTADHLFYLEGGVGVEAGNLLPGFVLDSLDEENEISVNSIKKLAEREDVYCGTVNGLGNFYVAVDDLDGVRVSNCGEQPLPPYGSCLLGSINLTRFVINPFTDRISFDMASFSDVVRVFTRMLDNVVELNGLPLEQQRHEILHKRRHGMGFFGLGSAMTMLRMRYGDKASIAFAEKVTREMAVAGWEEGFLLADAKGPAPIMSEMFDLTPEILSRFPDAEQLFPVNDGKIRGSRLIAHGSRYMADVPNNTRSMVSTYGSRFSHHTSIAPTGTIALSLGNNASSGIEPSFAHKYSRNIVREGKKTKERVEVLSYELLAYRALVNPNADPDATDGPNKLPDYFVDASDIHPKAHVDVQAAVQKWVDSSISKTINVPTDFPFEDFKEIYLYAYEKGLKGCTTFRPNASSHHGVLVKGDDVKGKFYMFTTEKGDTVTLRGDEMVYYDGETHMAANLYSALKDGSYGV